MSKELKIDICATCRFGVQNYVSIIGTIPWFCEKHWHCKPGRLASDYMPKDKGVIQDDEGRCDCLT